MALSLTSLRIGLAIALSLSNVSFIDDITVEADAPNDCGRI